MRLLSVDVALIGVENIWFLSLRMDAIFQCILIIGKFEKGNICPFFIIMLLQKYYSMPLDAVLEKSKRYTKA